MLPSIPELVRVMLLADQDVIATAPGGVVIGPAGHDQQEAGAIVVRSNGLTKQERDVPLARQSLILDCLASDVEHAERIAGAAQIALEPERQRRVVAQPSSGLQYLVHWTHIIGGPHQGRESDTIYNDALVIETLVGTEEVS